MSEPKQSTRSETGFLIAEILAAIGASVCCVGPLVLLALGVSGAWIYPGGRGRIAAAK